MPCQTSLQEIVKFVGGSNSLLWCGHDSFMNDIKNKCSSTEQIYSYYTLFTLCPCYSDIPGLALPFSCFIQMKSFYIFRHSFKKIKKGQDNIQLIGERIIRVFRHLPYNGHYNRNLTKCAKSSCTFSLILSKL